MKHKRVIARDKLRQHLLTWGDYFFSLMAKRTLQLFYWPIAELNKRNNKRTIISQLFENKFLPIDCAFLSQVFINFARKQTDETDLEDKAPKSRRPGCRFRVRRRAERLRAMWSDDISFRALEEQPGAPGDENDDDDWQVTFSNRVSNVYDPSPSPREFTRNTKIFEKKALLNS